MSVLVDARSQVPVMLLCPQPSLEPNVKRTDFLRPRSDGNLLNMFDATSPQPTRQVRASFDEATLVVYQAYSSTIADAALAAGTFVPPFKLDRMTWIKPSFLWMMYRSGWATKPGQERILAIRMSRSGFDQALTDSCLSHFESGAYPDVDAWQRRKRISPVRVQWDPERTLRLEPLPWRTIQVGLGGSAAHRYVRDWITDITDITETVHKIHQLIDAGDDLAAHRLVPTEQAYPLSPGATFAVAATDNGVNP